MENFIKSSDYHQPCHIVWRATVENACCNFIVHGIISTLLSACSVTNAPLTELPYLGGANMNIFHDMIFNCHGKIFQWQFFARRTGTVFLDVWRLVANNKMRLIGKNRVIVSVNHGNSNVIC